jgi:hypothetical protein
VLGENAIVVFGAAFVVSGANVVVSVANAVVVDALKAGAYVNEELTVAASSAGGIADGVKYEGFPEMA